MCSSAQLLSSSKGYRSAFYSFFSSFFGRLPSKVCVVPGPEVSFHWPFLAAAQILQQPLILWLLDLCWWAAAIHRVLNIICEGMELWLFEMTFEISLFFVFSFFCFRRFWQECSCPFAVVYYLQWSVGSPLLQVSAKNRDMNISGSALAGCIVHTSEIRSHIVRFLRIFFLP